MQRKDQNETGISIYRYLYIGVDLNIQEFGVREGQRL